MEKTEFVTFRDLTGGYWNATMEQPEPSAGNELRYRKFKVTIEPVEEDHRTLIERLEEMLLLNDSWNRRNDINAEIKKLQRELIDQYHELDKLHEEEQCEKSCHIEQPPRGAE